MKKKLDEKALARLAFTLYPFIYPGGEQSVDTDALDERIQRIRGGSLPEDEFFAMLSWLGHCETLHRLDQRPMPIKTSNKKFQAPDFLIFASHQLRIVPFLVEVKTSAKDKLVWKESYLNSLKEFAATLKLPLLVAWKWNGIWLLVDCAHFKKKVSAYHLNFETALKENLLGLLFENVLIKVNPNSRFIIDAEVINTELDARDELISEGEYTFKLKGAGFYVGETLIKDISPECSMLLFSVFNDNVVRKLPGNRVKVTYEPMADHCTIYLFDLLLTNLYMNLNRDDTIEWDQILREASLESSGEELRKALHGPGTSQFIDYIGRQVPNTMPDFLRDLTS